MRSDPDPVRVASRRRNRPMRTAPAALIALTVSVLAVGCQVPGTGSGLAAPTMSTITVAAVPGVENAPLYLANRDGFFKDVGLTVNIQTYSSVGKEIAALSNGSAQFAVGDYTDFFYAEDKPHQPGFLIVADAYDATPSVITASRRWPPSRCSATPG